LTPKNEQRQSPSSNDKSHPLASYYHTVEGDDGITIGRRGIIGFGVDPALTGCRWSRRTEGRGLGG